MEHQALQSSRMPTKRLRLASRRVVLHFVHGARIRLVGYVTAAEIFWTAIGVLLGDVFRHATATIRFLENWDSLNLSTRTTYA